MKRPTVAELTLPVGERDHVRGDEDAPVTLVEYGDYECPYSGRVYSIVKEVQNEFGDDLRFVFRNFPLENMHPHARRAAEAAEEAGTQGNFWAMHDHLYEHQDALDDEHLIEYATEIGLNIDQFKQELAEHAHEERVQEDLLSGARSGVQGTPMFFIDGERYEDQWNAESLVTALRKRLK